MCFQPQAGVAAYQPAQLFPLTVTDERDHLKR
jgi:hypothetical protein